MTLSKSITRTAPSTVAAATIVTSQLAVQTRGKGFVDLTGEIRKFLIEANAKEGAVTLFIRHTSASLTIQENADPSVCRDLEAWLTRLVPEGDPLYTHTAEGSDDMPAHIKGALTPTSVSVPVLEGRPALGTWQGIFLWEHRRNRGERTVLVHVGP